MKPIYEPKGRAKEYGDCAINIYTGCPHRCYYCFAPGVLSAYPCKHPRIVHVGSGKNTGRVAE